MINKRNAIRLLVAFWPEDYKFMDRFELRKQIAETDAKLIEAYKEAYLQLGDIRQSVLVAIAIRDGADLVDKVSEYFDQPGKVSTDITGHKWAKRVANKVAAKKIACQFKHNLPCSGAKGCGCGG